MKFRILNILGLLFVLFAVIGCASGASKEEYEALLNKFNAMKSENTALLEENKSLKTQLETLKGDVNKYKTIVTKANAFAAFMDVYADIYRWTATKPTKYGYDGKTENQDSTSKLNNMTTETGDKDLIDKLQQALILPVGAQKDKAWAEWQLRFAEGLFSITKP